MVTLPPPTTKQVLASKLLGDKQDTPAAAGCENAKAQHEHDCGGAGGAPLSTAVATDDGETDAAFSAGPEAKGGAIAGSGVGATDESGGIGPEGEEAGVGPHRRAGGVDGGDKQAGAESERRAKETEEEEVRIVAVDLQGMAPIEGVKQLQVGHEPAGWRHSCTVVPRKRGGWLLFSRVLCTCCRGLRAYPYYCIAHVFESP